METRMTHHETVRLAKEPTTPVDDTNPGDEAPPDAPGTGEDLCRDCAGTGWQDGVECPTCNGTGRIVEGIGGA